MFLTLGALYFPLFSMPRVLRRISWCRGVQTIPCPVDLGDKKLGVDLFSSISTNTSSSFFIHSTTFTRTTLKLRAMKSNAQETRRSGRQIKKSFKVRENDALASILLEALLAEAQYLVDKGIPQFESKRRLPFESIRPRVPVVSLL